MFIPVPHGLPSVAALLPRHPLALLVFLPALLLTAVLHLGRSRRHDAHAVYTIVPPTADRFSHPWRHPHALDLPTLTNARHRLLYTAPRRPSTLHLGRHFEAVLSDISLAHRLSASYAFPRGPSTSDAVFAWHPGSIRADFIARAVCKPRSTSKSPLSRCAPCTALRRPNPLHLRAVLRVPASLSAVWPQHPARDEALAAFLRGPARRANHVLFVPSAARAHCPYPAVPSTPIPRATGLVFRRYWSAHGTESLQTLMDYAPPPSSVQRRKAVPFTPLDLVVALHARRGDRLQRATHGTSAAASLVPTHVYGLALMHVLRIVQRRGGPFARLRVAVHVYSDGYGNASASAPASTPTSTLERLPEPDGELLSRAALEELLLPDPDLAPAGLRVVPHIGTPLIDTIHEMASADIVLGSNSRLTTMIVQTISRAAFVLVPVSRYDIPHLAPDGGPSTRTFFEAETGELVDAKVIDGMWRQFAFYNGFAVREALINSLVAEDDKEYVPDVDQGGSVVNTEEDLGEVSVKNKVANADGSGTGYGASNTESPTHGSGDGKESQSGNEVTSVSAESTNSGSDMEGAQDDEVTDRKTSGHPEDFVQGGSTVNKNKKNADQQDFNAPTTEHRAAEDSDETEPNSRGMQQTTTMKKKASKKKGLLNQENGKKASAAEFGEGTVAAPSDTTAAREESDGSSFEETTSAAKEGNLPAKKLGKKKSRTSKGKNGEEVRSFLSDGQKVSVTEGRWEEDTPNPHAREDSTQPVSPYAVHNSSAGRRMPHDNGDAFDSGILSPDHGSKTGASEYTEQNNTSSPGDGHGSYDGARSEGEQAEGEHAAGPIALQKSVKKKKRKKGPKLMWPAGASSGLAESQVSSNENNTPGAHGWSNGNQNPKAVEEGSGDGGDNDVQPATEGQHREVPSSNGWTQHNEVNGGGKGKVYRSDHKLLSISGEDEFVDEPEPRAAADRTEGTRRRILVGLARAMGEYQGRLEELEWFKKLRRLFST